jgi:hypothetical protein
MRGCGEGFFLFYVLVALGGNEDGFSAAGTDFFNIGDVLFVL